MPTRVTTQNERIVGSRLSASDPAMDATQYTSGDLVLSTVARAFYANADGTLSVDFMGGIDGKAASTTITFVVTAGTIIPGFIVRVNNGSPAGVLLY